MVVSIEVIHLVRLLRGTDLYQAIQNLEPVRLTTTPTSIRSDAAAISTTGRQGSVVTATSGSSRLSIRVATLISWVNYMTYWPNQPTPASATSLGLRRLATRGQQRLFAREPIRGHSGFPLKYNVPFSLTRPLFFATNLGLRRLATRCQQRLFANPFRDRRLRSRTEHSEPPHPSVVSLRCP